MRVYRYGDPGPSSSVKGNVSVAIGNFDGFHLGHQSLIKKLTFSQKGILSFYPHPRLWLSRQGGSVVADERLQNLRTKIYEAKKLQLDFFALVRFTESLREMDSETFVDSVLVKFLNVKQVVIGSDWRFGKDRTGDVDVLAKLGASRGFQVTVCDLVDEGGKPIGSSRVRESLDNGDLESCHSLLGRPFGFKAKVISGDKRGRELGFPTANLNTVRQKLPPKGVYASIVTLRGKEYQAVTNVGNRPTFSGAGVRAETHLIDYNGTDFYHEEIGITFNFYIRAEKKFSGIEELKNQISVDIERAVSALQFSSS